MALKNAEKFAIIGLLLSLFVFAAARYFQASRETARITVVREEGEIGGSNL